MSEEKTTIVKTVKIGRDWCEAPPEGCGHISVLSDGSGVVEYTCCTGEHEISKEQMFEIVKAVSKIHGHRWGFAR